jgi:hypothetical protein
MKRGNLDGDLGPHRCLGPAQEWRCPTPPWASLTRRGRDAFSAVADQMTGVVGGWRTLKSRPLGEARAGNPTLFIGGCRIISVERFGRRAFPRHTTTARRPFLVTFTRRRRTSVGPPLTPSGITTREPEANASWGTDRASETGTETTSVVAASGPNLGLRARGGYKPWTGTSTRL